MVGACLHYADDGGFAGGVVCGAGVAAEAVIGRRRELVGGLGRETEVRVARWTYPAEDAVPMMLPEG